MKTLSLRRKSIGIVFMVLAAVAGTAAMWRLAEQPSYADAKSEAQEAQAQLARLEQTSEAFRLVAKALKPSVVSIRSEKTLAVGPMSPFRPFGFDDMDPFWRRFFGDDMPFFFRDRPREGRRPKQQGLGSGVIVDTQGYILTNNHVVDGADTIVVQLSDKREFKITGEAVKKQVWTDPKTDLAVLKIEAPGLVAAPLGDSSKLEVGDWVLAIGNPFGLELTVTAGIVSAKGRHQLAGLATYQDFIQTDAAINPGNSGGPLANLKGEVVGISTAIFSRSGGYMGIGFAIPSNMARSIMASLIKEGKVTRGYLGVYIQDITPELAEHFGLKSTEGVLLPEIIPNSPAAKAGLKEGDVVLKIDGKPVANRQELQLTVASLPVGKTVELLIRRGNQTLPIRVTIGEMPDEEPRLAGGPGREREDLGLEVQDLSPELARRFGYREAQGVIITHVEPDSPADDAELEPGQVIVQVNGVPVRDAAQFRSLIGQADLKKGVLLLVKTPQGSQFKHLQSK